MYAPNSLTMIYLSALIVGCTAHENIFTGTVTFLIYYTAVKLSLYSLANMHANFLTVDISISCLFLFWKSVVTEPKGFYICR